VAGDVFDFLAHQRGDRRVVRLNDGESGLSARTIARKNGQEDRAKLFDGLVAKVIEAPS
jgi:hypothetical protein